MTLDLSKIEGSPIPGGLLFDLLTDKKEVEIKITNIRFISDYQMSFEFWTDEDKRLYEETDDKIIKLVIV